MFKGLVTQRLLSLFAGGAMLFNFPLLALWDRDVLLLGMPLFPAALFIVWAGLIALLAFIVERDDPSGASPPAPPAPRSPPTPPTPRAEPGRPAPR